MKNNYSIDEILNAVNELEKIKKDRNLVTVQKKHLATNKISIPKDTLKLIEQAEKSKN